MTEAAVLDAPTQPAVRPKPNRVDVAKALKLRMNGATLEDIADLQGVSKQAIDQALKTFEPFIKGLEPGQLTAYSEERAGLFNVVEKQLTGLLLDQQKGEKASLNNVAYALKVVHEARRLETGQSTSNMSVLASIVTKAESSIVQAIDNVDKPVNSTVQTKQRRSRKSKINAK